MDLKKEHFLRTHFESLIDLSDKEFENILNHFSLKKLRKHQYLVQEGDLVLQRLRIICKVVGQFKKVFHCTDSKVDRYMEMKLVTQVSYDKEGSIEV
jgi:hypothetical protein